MSLTQSAKAVVITSLLLITATAAAAEYTFYRYVNNDGVKVLDHSIPPEYAQKGYEIVNASGQVIKVVPPAPTEEELARSRAEQEIKQRYILLKRRYSSVQEMESAKQRRLKNLDTNISILKGNISGLNTHIEHIMSDAANFERRNRAVPDHILRKLNDAKTELGVAKEQLEIRQQEYKEIIQKFDEDIANFRKGKVLEEASSASEEQPSH